MLKRGWTNINSSCWIDAKPLWRRSYASVDRWSFTLHVSHASEFTNCIRDWYSSASLCVFVTSRHLLNFLHAIMNLPSLFTRHVTPFPVQWIDLTTFNRRFMVPPHFPPHAPPHEADLGEGIVAFFQMWERLTFQVGSRFTAAKAHTVSIHSIMSYMLLVCNFAFMFLCEIYVCACVCVHHNSSEAELKKVKSGIRRTTESLLEAPSVIIIVGVALYVWRYLFIYSFIC